MEARRVAGNLDRNERRIEASIHKYVPVSDEAKKRVLAKTTKTKTVSLRLNETVLESIRRKAAAEGLSYQTLISSVLYKYSTDRLVEEDKIRKAVELIRHR
jgi:predicted DNA binding CopG/RHH family protein